jgi:hypothetical protein
MLEVLQKRYSEEQKREYVALYEQDVRKAAKILCKTIAFDLGSLETQKEADQITKCLWLELRHIESLHTANTIITILKEFSDRFMMTEEGRTEVLRLVRGEYEVESDSENSDCDSLCSSCESSGKRERDGWHRLRMVIREMAGAEGRRMGVAIKKNIQIKPVRRVK